VRVLLVASEAAGLKTLRALGRTSHHLVGILTAPSPSGFKGSSFEVQAEKAGVPVWPATFVKDPGFAAQVRETEVDILLNVHSLHLAHEAVLSAPRVGAFNLHPGPLPRYAGLNAPLWAVYRGETTYGVTLHWMTPFVDAGPIAYQRLFPLGDEETGLSLFLKCIEDGLLLVAELLETAEAAPDRIPRLEQRLERREYLRSGPPEEGRLRWDRPADEVVRFVRACDFRPFVSPWGHPRAPPTGHKLGVLSCRPTGRAVDGPPGALGEVVGSGVEVSCADTRVILEDVLHEGRACKAADVVARSR
jgi:methionyl-tRNA formyltransferase